ncbi:sulfotransferase family protein [Streptosporangium sp. DT93]|uniref:sulfotransferase family protein n=1 Tax=Streptosporangium sp. DT93 TaxID=3393428 RepID=UPI003CE6F9D2
MRPPPHILVVNGIKVRRPVFVLAAPHSGADLLARALKRSPGFHVTMGRAAVAHVVYAFARRPSIAGRGMGATRVLRDALAESWQLLPGACAECPPPCREAGGVTGAGPCTTSDAVARFGDASPDLIYSAPVLLQAFPDARFVQLIRDGRDVAADMLADPASMTWFKPSMLSEETEFPNPFLGVNSGEHSERWKAMPTAGKCALRWRSAVRLSASLHQELPRDQLHTVRYEDLVSSPAETVDGLSRFLETRVPKIALLGPAAPRVGIWRTRLRETDAELVSKVAREELARLGYAPQS